MTQPPRNERRSVDKALNMPEIDTACRYRHLLIWPAILAAGILCAPSARANVGMAECSPEGFSVSSEGLPEQAIEAWYATVIIEGEEIVWPRGKQPRRRTRSGSGIVVRLDKRRGVAVIATNAHIITCGEKACGGLRVGFGDPFSPKGPKWTETVRIVSRKTDKDLAFVEAQIPDGAETREARFASPECTEAGVDTVMSIGWPDLTIRKKWGVERPANYKDRVKRHSDGLFLTWLRGYRMRPEVDRMLERLQVVFHNADVLPGSSGGPLLNRDGEVIGVNTAVVSGVEEPDHHRFCARRDPHRRGECVHVAIASGELMKEYERIYASRITLANCSSTSEFEQGR